MKIFKRLPFAANLTTLEEERRVLDPYLRPRKESRNGHLSILEAGCGRKCRLNLKDLQFTLTGVDFDKNALELRKNTQKDLHVAIVGDLRSVTLEENSFDIIFSCNVLEHVENAELVLKNFVRWLKPGGKMILIFPNRDSAYSFVTRVTPFWMHVLYKKYIQRVKNAGKPGFDPYPVHFDRVVSRRGIYDFCTNENLIMKAEYRMDRKPGMALWLCTSILLWGLATLSFGTLSVNHRNLLYVLEKK
jgi:SAM-dependent methyltransferase